LFRWCDAAKFDTERIWGCVMHDLTVQGQSVFVIHEQEAQLVANFYVWARGQVADPQATKADIRGFTESDRLSQTFVFDSQSQASIDVVAWKLASFVIG